MAKYIFLTRMFVDKSKEEEAEFNRWYWEEHIPVLSKVPGVLKARRFMRVPVHYPDAPKYLAIYDLENAGVVEGYEWNSWAYSSEWAKRTKPNREGTPGVYEEVAANGDNDKIEASYLYVNRIYPKPGREDFFRHWAETTLLPTTGTWKGISKSRLYLATGNAHKHTPKFLVLLEMNGLEVMSEEGWKSMASSEGILKPVKDLVFLKNFPGFYERLVPPRENPDLTFRW